MKRHFCTYFNSGYLDRAMALIESMRQQTPGFSLDVLCFDEVAFDYFTRHPVAGVRTETLGAFEARNPDVAGVKTTRSRGEYFFTCTGAWTLDVLKRHPEIDVLTYLDADLCFFASPEPVFEAMSGKDIVVTEHQFSPRQSGMLKYGRFNVGWLSFRNSEAGLACLSLWRSQCVAWCFDRLEDGKFADQKYLDEWPSVYGERLLIAAPGVNTGPWALARGVFTVDPCGVRRVSGHPLIVYHFQGLRLYSRSHYYMGYILDFWPREVIRHVYAPYVRSLVDFEALSRSCSAAHARYAKEWFPIRALMGYWLERPGLTLLIWSCQRLILGLFNRKSLLFLMGRKRAG
jgi:hypothetical protein